MSRNYDKAAEFCQLVGTPDLLEYLQVPPDQVSDEAIAALKKRRKYMQGMQSNPKYRKEALFLIKHFKSLQSALEDPEDYQRDALRRAESVHLPILEMTVKGVLAGGTLTKDQETYLLRNATELGVSLAAFEELMTRLCAEAGVSRPSASSAQTVTPATAPPVRKPGDDFYTLLGLSNDANLPTIRAAYETKMSEARGLPSNPETEELIVRLDLAWSVLSDPRARETYHITSTRTGPPARQREIGGGPHAIGPGRKVPASGSPSAAYRPPPGTGSRLEVLGDPVLQITVGSALATVAVRIRNGGADAMGGRIISEQPWVITNPTQIDPTLQEQDIEVVFDPQGMPTTSATAVINIVTDRGEQAAITFHVSRSRTALYVGIGSLVLLLVLGAGTLATLLRGPSDVQLEIDPWGQEVLFDGVAVGSGSSITLEAVDPGEHSLEVKQPNFQPLKRTITSSEIASGKVRVELEPLRRLNFVPSDSLRRTSIPQDEASQVFGERAAGIDACIERVVQPGSVLTGAVRVHIDKDGLAAGIETQGKHTDQPDVARCLEREAAALVFSPLGNGDYATVRYEYTVTAPDSK